MGTIDYMAPEQALYTRLAMPADIYSLCCTLYRLLVGESPYGGETMMEKLLVHREQPIPSLRARRQDVPAPAEAIYTKMMAKEASDRYQTMAEVTTALEQWRGAEPSRPAASSKVLSPNPTRSCRRSCRRCRSRRRPRRRLACAKASAGSIDATVSFQNAEVDTDPKSQMTSPQALPLGSSNVPPRRPDRRLLAAGGGALAWSCCWASGWSFATRTAMKPAESNCRTAARCRWKTATPAEAKSKTKTPTPRRAFSSTSAAGGCAVHRR